MTHEELCERARRWLSGTRRCEPVFSNVASCREIPDAIGWSSCYHWHGSTVIEAKTSPSDFYADRNKYWVWSNERDAEEGITLGMRFTERNLSEEEAAALGYRKLVLPRMGDYRFFMCEPGVLSAELIAKHAPDHGLIWADGSRRVQIVTPAPRRTELVDKDGEIRYLRFAIINRKTPHQEPGLPCAFEAEGRA